MLIGALVITTFFFEASSAQSAFTPPKTPWGDPDLQGVWPGTNLVGVPLQRPASFGERATLTEQELAQRQQQAEQTEKVDSEEFVTEATKCNPNGRGLGETPGTCKDGVRIGPPRYWDEHGKPSPLASLVVDPPNGQIPALTPEAQKAAADRRTARAARPCSRSAAGCHDSWEDESLWDRCITRGTVGSMVPNTYNEGNQILQEPGYVILRNEMIHEARVIPLEVPLKTAHAASGIRSWMGDSRGHWEGNTLVVETTNFKAQTSVNNTETSEDLKLVERFTLTRADTLQYSVTISDPKTWTKPWTIAFPLPRESSYKLYEYACHEGNYYMRNALTGSRAEEQKGSN
jgi:hypothetical protein